MSDHYQEDGIGGATSTEPVEPEAPQPPGSTLPGGPRLGAWFVILVAAGAVSFVFGLQETAFLVALSGLFVAAQAADLYPGQKPLYWALTWVVPVGGAATFSAITWLILSGEASPLRNPMAAVAAASALACLLTVLRPVSDGLTRALFRGEPPSHALRLAARLVLMGLLLALPGWYAFRDSFEELLGDESLINEATLGSGLIGYVVLALAAVGFLVRRNLADTLQRLGLRPFGQRDYAVIPVGVALLFALNVGLETVQRTWFPELWESDLRVTELIAGGLTTGQVLMVGLSAGIGEEITLRGGLQPRMGIFMTSLLFAALHVQYSWFGMGVIFAFGVLLGLIRKHTNTGVAIVIHTIYDIVAIFST